MKCMILCIVAILLCSCIFENESKEDFSVELTVKDYDGYLVDDLRVSFINKAMFDTITPGKIRNCVTINFSIEKRTEAQIEIKDINNNSIRTLLDEIVEKGEHRVVWNCKNDNNEIMKNGLYYCEMKTFNDIGEIVYFNRIIMYMLSSFDVPHVMTNNGKAIFFDKKPFLNFYVLDDIEVFNEMNDEINIVNFSDTTYVYMEKGEFHCVGSFVAKDKKNSLNLTWIPEGWKEQMPNKKTKNAHIDKSLIYTTKLRNCYPNPF